MNGIAEPLSWLDFASAELVSDRAAFLRAMGGRIPAPCGDGDRQHLQGKTTILGERKVWGMARTSHPWLSEEPSSTSGVPPLAPESKF